MQSSSNSYIFNQYYIEILKVCKNNAKSAKDRPGGRGKMARDLLRAVKKHYASFDKLSSDHIEFFKAQFGEVAEKYIEDGVFETVESVALEEGSDKEWFHDIKYAQVKEFGKDLQQNWTILGLLIRDDIDGSKVVEVSRKMADKTEYETAVETAFGDNEAAKTALKRLRISYEDKVKMQMPMFDGIEDTSLGKLAKEIMDDPDVQTLHENLKHALDGNGSGSGSGNGNGSGDSDATGPENLLKMLGSGESGNDIAKLMGTVSQKMLQKMMSGEIKQENLLQDAMTFASKMGGSTPGGMDLSSIGKMLSGLAGGGGGGGGPGGFDLSSMMNAFGGGGKKKSNRSKRHESASGARRKLAQRKADKEKI